VPRDYSPTKIYTQPFTKKFAEKLINESVKPEFIQYQISEGSAISYAGYSKEEWLECSWKELELRGRIGAVNLYPPDYQITKIPVAERVAITQDILGNRK
jgi:hypothetical protein